MPTSVGVDSERGEYILCIGAPPHVPYHKEQGPLPSTDGFAVALALIRFFCEHLLLKTFFLTRTKRRSMENLILKGSHEQVHIQETDSASANVRLFNYRLQRHQHETLLQEMVCCHAHQANLVETSCVGASGPKLISSFFSFCHFLQAGTHWSKLKEAVRQYVVETAEISVATSAGAELPLYTQELAQMQALVRKALTQSKTKHAEMADLQEKDVAHCQFDKHVAEFLRMWNGDLTGKKCEHRCFRTGPPSNWCCQDDEESKSKLASSLIAFALHSVPETPAPAKWTKLWSCLSFLINGFLCSSWLASVVPRWLPALKILQKKPKQSGEPEDDIDPALAATQEYAKIAGKRAKKTEQFVSELATGDLGLRLLILLLVDEPLRFLTMEFLRFSDAANTEPALFCLCNEHSSALVAACQYLSSLLLTDASRLELLYRKFGYSNIMDWEASEVKQVRHLRPGLYLKSYQSMKLTTSQYLWYPVHTQAFQRSFSVCSRSCICIWHIQCFVHGTYSKVMLVSCCCCCCCCTIDIQYNIKQNHK